MVFLKGDAGEGLDCFNRSIIFDQSLVQNYVKRASISMERGDIHKALKQFEIAISLNPNDPDIYYYIGQGIKRNINSCNRIELLN